MKLNSSSPYNTFRRLVLIGNFLPDHQESMQRYTRMLSEGFSARGLEVDIWRPEPHYARLSPGGYRYGGLPKYLGYLDKFHRFPRQLRRRIDEQPAGTVFHITDHSNAIYAPHFKGRPLVVTVHDLLQIRSALGEFPQNRLGSSGRRYQRWIHKHLAHVPIAACISQKTRDDLLRLTSLQPDATPIVGNCLNHTYRPMPAEEAAPLLARILPAALLPPSSPETGGYFIAIAGAQWYKNRTGLISIFAALKKILETSRRKLLYIGPDFDAEQKALIARHALGSEIIHARNLTNDELCAAYSHAEALLFPSWEEGFGWPIAEALSCGCPVFTSNRAPMTEVGGEAAVYIDPAVPTASAAIIAQTIAISKKQLREAALHRAERWKPQHMIEAYAQLYAAAAATAAQ